MKLNPLLLWRRKKMFRLPIYGDEALVTAFEFGLVIADVAKRENVELNHEILERAEKILVSEIRKSGWKKTTLNFLPLALASFQK